MKQRSLLVAVVAIAMALALAVTCILYFASPGKNVIAEGSTQTSADETPADDPTDSDTEATAPAAVESYDFTSAEFDQSAWTRVAAGTGNSSITAGTGLQTTYGLNVNRNGYATPNPLKGEITDGFSVIFTAAVTGGITDGESMFGFNPTADPNDDPFNCLFICSDGYTVRLNANGNDGSGVQLPGTNFYDIVGTDSLDMTDLSQYILTVDASAITIYLNGVLIISYPWTAGNTAAYGYNTLTFVNNSDYFNVGIASFWGNAEMTVSGVSLYNTALTAEEIAAINASYADFTQLNALLNELKSFSASNYDTSLEGWDTAYSAFTNALAAAESLSFFTATQTEVNSAYTALSDAYEGLTNFYRTPDIADGLVSAYPLSSDGYDITDPSNSSNEVLVMNGSATASLTAGDSFSRRQGRTAAKTYDPTLIRDRELSFTSAVTGSMTGLKIPSAAFADVTTSTGMTLSVDLFVDTWTAAPQPHGSLWIRTFQLGSKASGDGASSSQIYFDIGSQFILDIEATRFNITTPAPSNVNHTYDGAGDIIAGEWFSVSLAFDPSSLSITLYVSSDTTDRINNYTGKDSYTYIAPSQAIFNEIFSAIINGTDNWIGRSFWSSDSNLLGLASNLTVYNRALTSDEITQLHEISDVTSLMTTE